MNDLRHDPDAIDPVAERTAWLRQWQPVPPGVKPWGRTVMHQDGNTYTNVDPPAKWQGSTRDDTPPAPEAPDLRTVGERVAECEQAIAALWDETGSESWNMRQLLGRVETLERSMRHAEALLHRLLNPGEQEGGNSLDDVVARLQRLESMFQSLMYAGMALAETDTERYKVMAAYSVHQYFHGPGEQEVAE